VQVTALSGARLSDEEALAQAARLWQRDTDAWELLVRHDVVRALPQAVPPLEPSRSSTAGGGLFVCGDHRTTPSIQGALSSGTQAADDVVAALGAG
jgi:predicted NAD/FAD-dependent oxidoreductase